MIEQTVQPHKARVLVVDNDPDLLLMLDSALTDFGCAVCTALSASEAFVVAENAPPDLILLDIVMPDTDGFQACERFKKNSRFKDVPVIFISAQNSSDTKVKAFQAGGVDCITKPFHLAELEARIETHLNLCSLSYKLECDAIARKQIQEVMAAQQATIFALAKLAEHRDCDTGAHLERVRTYCRLLAEKLYHDSPYAVQLSAGFAECIQFASPLHDIGKVAIPDSILLKPGPLNSEEYEIMKSHTIVGAETLQVVFNEYSGNSFIGTGIEIALYHHERWDGKGYPDGLVGKNIPLSARITALADFYDALCSDRCYRKAFSHENVKTMIKDGSGKHFDPEVVKAFLALEGEFRRIMDGSA